MKKGIHPEYKPVLFRCASSGETFVCGSTRVDGPEHEFEGKKYPSIMIEVSAYSHPFYTGKQQFIDTEGRVEKFNTRFKGAFKSKEDREAEAQAAAGASAEASAS